MVTACSGLCPSGSQVHTQDHHLELRRVIAKSNPVLAGSANDLSACARMATKAAMETPSMLLPLNWSGIKGSSSRSSRLVLRDFYRTKTKLYYEASSIIICGNMEVSGTISKFFVIIVTRLTYPCSCTFWPYFTSAVLCLFTCNIQIVWHRSLSCRDRQVCGRWHHKFTKSCASQTWLLYNNHTQIW